MQGAGTRQCERCDSRSFLAQSPLGALGAVSAHGYEICIEQYFFIFLKEAPLNNRNIKTLWPASAPCQGY